MSLLVVLIHSVNLAIDNTTLSSMILTADHTGAELAGITGIALGVNLWNALVVGILGVPGLVLLLLTQWVL